MAMTETDELFAHTPPGRLFLRAALPGAAGMFVSSIYSLMDGVLVGRFIGETAFAAINLAMPFIILSFAFGDLIGCGSAVPISISLGKGDEAYANEVFSFSIIFNVITGCVLGALFFITAPAIMTAMGASGELARLASSYLRVYALFLPVNTVLYASDNYLRISGKIRMSFLVNLFSAVFGAAFEYYLLGARGFGVVGAALAYSISMAVASVASLLPFARGDLQLKFVRPHFDGAMMLDIVKNGLPVFLENTSGRIASIVLNIALLRMGGEEAVSVWGVLMFCGGIVMPLIYGMIDALQPAVGFNWGAHDLSRVKELEFYCFATSAGLGLAFVLFVQAFPDVITYVFLPEASPELVEMSVGALRLYGFSYIVRWLPSATQSFMIAVSQARLASLISVVMAFAAPLIALIVLWPLGLQGLWLNIPVASVISSVVCIYVLWRFKTTINRRLA